MAMQALLTRRLHLGTASSFGAPRCSDADVPHYFRSRRCMPGQTRMHGRKQRTFRSQMALTLQDLQAAAFGASLQDIQDVALANMVWCAAASDEHAHTSAAACSQA